ncbi:MAG: DUF1223 domain-containing protein [Alphaproteobacteria bacterium]|nr:DUF1223 domain-containing protein [Alphaproteobacteria bacterium]
MPDARMLARMKRPFLRFAAALLLAFGLTGAVAAAQERGTLVIELFTSQGCASCPRANRMLGALSLEEDVIALTYPVDYWDYLGWRDTFARSEFTSRQRAYGRALHTRALYTPQIIVQGLFNANAARASRVRSALNDARAATPPQGPDIIIRRSDEDTARVYVSAGPSPEAAADIWLMTYVPGPVSVAVTAGENAGNRVGHYNLVRSITHLGAWEGRSLRFADVACRPACAVLVQAQNAGAILSAAQLRAEAAQE